MPLSSCVCSIDKPDSSFTSSAELKAKKFYQSCMDPDKVIEKAGAQPLLDLMETVPWVGKLSTWGPRETVNDNWSLKVINWKIF